MNYTHRVLSLSLFAWCILAGNALAESKIPDDIKKSDVLTPQQIEIIRAAVRGQVAKVADPSPDAQKAARDSLISDSKTASAPATAAYCDEYAKQLNAAIVESKILSNTNVRVRLNVGVAVARVAEEARNARLQEATLALLKDSSDAVVIWGLKAAKVTLPVMLKLNQGNALVDAVQAAATKPHPSGVTLVAVYETLSVYDGDVNGPVVPAFKPAAAAMLKVAKARIAQYKSGNPAEVGAEGQAAFYLTQGKVWAILTDSERADVAQSVADFFWLGTQLHMNQSIPAEHRNDLVGMLSRLGGAIWVIGQNTGNKALQDAVGKPSEWNANTTAQQLVAVGHQAFAILKTIYPSFVSPVDMKIAATQPTSSATAGAP